MCWSDVCSQLANNKRSKSQFASVIDAKFVGFVRPKIACRSVHQKRVTSSSVVSEEAATEKVVAGGGHVGVMEKKFVPGREAVKQATAEKTATGKSVAQKAETVAEKASTQGAVAQQGSAAEEVGASEKVATVAQKATMVGLVAGAGEKGEVEKVVTRKGTAGRTATEKVVGLC